MDRRIFISLIALALTIVAGCNEQPSTGPAASPAAVDSAVLSNPAAQAANQFLEALVKGDSQRVIELYTSQAAQRMQQFPLPGIADYAFRITGVGEATDNKVLVECRATTVAASGESEDEVICLLLENEHGAWRVAGMLFHPDPNASPMIFSFEAPDRGPIPLGQWLAESRGGGGEPRPSPPRTAQESEVVPAGGYR